MHACKAHCTPRPSFFYSFSWEPGTSIVPFFSCLWFSSPAPQQEMAGGLSVTCSLSLFDVFGSPAWKEPFILKFYDSCSKSALKLNYEELCNPSWMSDHSPQCTSTFLQPCVFVCEGTTTCIIQFCPRIRNITYWVINISHQNMQVSSWCFLFTLWLSLVFVILWVFLQNRKQAIYLKLLCWAHPQPVICESLDVLELQLLTFYLLAIYIYTVMSTWLMAANLWQYSVCYLINVLYFCRSTLLPSYYH